LGAYVAVPRLRAVANIVLPGVRMVFCWMRARDLRRLPRYTSGRTVATHRSIITTLRSEKRFFLIFSTGVHITSYASKRWRLQAEKNIIGDKSSLDEQWPWQSWQRQPMKYWMHPKPPETAEWVHRPH
jgi:hypothetical protein